MDKKRYTYEMTPFRPGEEDTLAHRMDHWEEANHMEISDLTEDEWIDVVATIAPMAEFEAEELLTQLRLNDSW